MNCDACGADNPSGNRFCGGCGAALEAAAPAPRAAVGDRPAPGRDPCVPTPKHLAEKIRQSEAWGALMQRFFMILAEGVERFEGFVDKFTGEGIMAVFGAPIARELDG